MGDDYTLHYQRFHPNTTEHLDGMVTYLRSFLCPLLPANKDINVLDVGCGFGFALLALRTLGIANITGIDVSPAQIEQAKDHGLCVFAVPSSVDFLAAHASEYDVVLLMDVLEHVPVAEQISFLRAIRLSLKAGGRLILTVPNANSPIASRRRYIDFTHHSAFTEHSLHHSLESSGFTKITILPTVLDRRPPLKLWERGKRVAFRKWVVRWCWLQVLRAEADEPEDTHFSFDPNLTAIADA